MIHTMLKMISSKHPRQKLLFSVTDRFDSVARDAVDKLVQRLKFARNWVVAPPQFINVVESLPPESSDTPVETLGGYLEIYSALPGNDLPKEVDRVHLQEVELLVKELCKLSLYLEASIELELDGQFVGSIAFGVPDRLLKVGMIEEWKTHLDGT